MRPRGRHSAHLLHEVLALSLGPAVVAQDVAAAGLPPRRQHKGQRLKQVQEALQEGGSRGRI